MFLVQREGGGGGGGEGRGSQNSPLVGRNNINETVVCINC